MNILEISPIGVYPPKSGGHTRIHNLNLEISINYNVFLFSQGIRKFELKFPLRSWITEINEKYIEYRFVSALSLAASYLFVLGKKNIPPIFSGDILKIVNPRILKKKMRDSDFIQIEAPWQFEYAYKNKPEDTPIVLVEHNVEFDLLEQSVSSKSILIKKLLRIAKEKERYAVESADAIFAMSQEDMDRLTEEFNVTKTKVHIIPNGVDVSKFYPSPKEEQERMKEKIGLGKKKVILFTGWIHHPNFEAVEEILKISDKIKNKDIIFLVAGRVGDSFENRENVLFTGYVEGIMNYFKAADIAINPMMSGSGTNLKMLEYLASGIATITTKIGARGLDVENEKDLIISKIEDFPIHINNLLNDDDLCTILRESGRKLVEEKYDWKKIAEKQIRVYEKLLER
jgi:glycosyltransferase involved in cell wall biosynthesis